MNGGEGGGEEIRVIQYAGHDFQYALEVRRKVFIEEQSVSPEEEFDAHDETSVHLLALCDGEPAGTLRFFDDAGWLHVGRVAVLPGRRGGGLGRRMMLRCIEEGRRRGLGRCFLNAQTDKMNFYRKLGFRELGDEFMDAGIPHYRMELYF